MTLQKDVEDSCSICLEPLVMNDLLGILPCAHGNFHKECVCKWLQYSVKCPLCRHSIEDSLDHLLSSDTLLSRIVGSGNWEGSVAMWNATHAGESSLPAAGDEDEEKEQDQEGQE